MIPRTMFLRFHNRSQIRSKLVRALRFVRLRRIQLYAFFREHIRESIAVLVAREVEELYAILLRRAARAMMKVRQSLARPRTLHRLAHPSGGGGRGGTCEVFRLSSPSSRPRRRMEFCSSPL